MASLAFPVVWRFFHPECDAPVEEYQFHKNRKWRFDYAFPVFMVAVEMEGGVYTGGRHVRGKGYTNDVKKYNAAAAIGWRIIRMTPEMWNDDPVAGIDHVMKVLKMNEGAITKVCRTPQSKQ